MYCKQTYIYKYIWHNDILFNQCIRTINWWIIMPWHCYMHYCFRWSTETLTGQKSEFSAMYCPISLCFAESAMISRNASRACCPMLPSLCTYGISRENMTNFVDPWSEPALNNNSKTWVSRERQTASWWSTCISCVSTDVFRYCSQSHDTSSLSSGRMIGLWTSSICCDWLIRSSYILRAWSLRRVEYSEVCLFHW